MKTKKRTDLNFEEDAPNGKAIIDTGLSMMTCDGKTPGYMVHLVFCSAHPSESAWLTPVAKRKFGRCGHCKGSHSIVGVRPALRRGILNLQEPGPGLWPADLVAAHVPDEPLKVAGVRR